MRPRVKTPSSRHITEKDTFLNFGGVHLTKESFGIHLEYSNDIFMTPEGSIQLKSSQGSKRMIEKETPEEMHPETHPKARPIPQKVRILTFCEVQLTHHDWAHPKKCQDHDFLGDVPKPRGHRDRLTKMTKI